MDIYIYIIDNIICGFLIVSYRIGIVRLNSELFYEFLDI